MRELPHRSLLPEDFSKKRSVLKKVAIRLVPVSVLIFAGCSGGGGVKNSSFQELENKESGYSLPFPEGETWFLTNGPHGDGSSNGVRNAIDIAPPELGRLNGNCPTDGSRLSIDNRFVTASASGKIALVGNGQRTDLFHSVVDVKDKKGLTQRYIHVDPILVKKGEKVNQGDPLGNPSCEYPRGGANTGPHVHVGLMKDGQPISVDGVKIGGWTIHEGVNSREGTMTKPGEQTRTADVGRYGENSAGIRNDLPNNPNKAVVASPKNPIPSISSTITSKEVFTAAATPTPTRTAIPTPKPTETQKPAENKISLFKKPDELYRSLFANPIPDGMLLPNVTLRIVGSGVSTFTAQGVKAIYQVDFILLDKNIEIETTLDQPNVIISYIIFPNNINVKSTYEAIPNPINSKKEIQDFDYPALVSAQLPFGGSVTASTMVFENVLVVTTLRGIGQVTQTQEEETINLAKAAMEFLKKVGTVN